MNLWLELMTVIGSFVGAAFAIVRHSLRQTAAMTERFVSFLEGSLVRQESVNAGFRDALENLTTCVRENSQLLNRLNERLPAHPGIPTSILEEGGERKAELDWEAF